MKLLRGLAALALALTLASTIAFAQVNPGTSPLSVPKGGTGAATAAGARSSLQVDRFTGHGDSNYIILVSDRTVGTNAAFTASRTWTLPAANAVNAGHSLIVADFQGTVTGSNTLVIARAGSDTINGGTSVTISSANGAYLLWSDGSSKWTAQAVGASIASGVSSLDGASGAISTQTGSLDVTGSTLSSNVLSSRAFAATQDLSAFSSIQTLGYATAGDGGGASFQKVVGAFIDTRILTGTLTANGTSGCTNGTYYGVKLDGGTGRGAYATVVVSGNVVTSITVGLTSTAGYSVGDVLTVGSDVPGCAGVKSWTVASITTPTGSFTDGAGNKWQILFPGAGLDARAMGVKFDWDGTDGTATDNFTTLQNALSFAYYKTSTAVDLGGAIGGQVLLAKGTAMVGCSGNAALVSPYGVKVRGQGNYSTVIKFCDTFNTNVNQWELCDRTTRSACFGTLLEDFQITNTLGVSGSSSRSVVYTNNAQHEAGMRRMVIIPGGCGRGATYETGYGGATYILMDSVEFKGGKSDANCGGAGGVQVYINYGSTQVIINNLNVSGTSSGSGGPRTYGIGIDGGFVDIVGFHAEQVVLPITVNIPTDITKGMVRLRQAIGGVDCVGMVNLTGVNIPGNFMISPPMALNGCTRLVTNNQSGGGTHLTSVSATDTVFTPNPRSW